MSFNIFSCGFSHTCSANFLCRNVEKCTYSCVYIYIYVCVCVCVCACVRACVRVCVCAYAKVCVWVYIYIYIWLCVCVCVCVCVRVCMCFRLQTGIKPSLTWCVPFSFSPFSYAHAHFASGYPSIYNWYLSSSRPSGLLRSPAICLEVSLLTVFLWGRRESFVFVVWDVSFDFYAAAYSFCFVVGILLWGCYFKFISYYYISLVVQKAIDSSFFSTFHFVW